MDSLKLIKACWPLDRLCLKRCSARTWSKPGQMLPTFRIASLMFSSNLSSTCTLEDSTIWSWQLIRADCLKDLKSYCEEILSRSLSASNAAEVFRVTDLVNALELKEDALFVIKAQPVDVVQSEGFQKFDFLLAKEIALALAELVECRFPECFYRTRLRLSQSKNEFSDRSVTFSTFPQHFSLPRPQSSHQ